MSNLLLSLHNRITKQFKILVFSASKVIVPYKLFFVALIKIYNFEQVENIMMNKTYTFKTSLNIFDHI